MRDNLLIYSLISLSLLLLSCNQTTRKNNTTNSETETEGTLLLENESEPKSSSYPNTLYSIAYIKNNKLFFYDFENHNKVEFIEEADTVLHCIYADDGNFYYTTSKNNLLTLKKIDFVNDNELSELYEFDIPAEEFINDLSDNADDILIINNHLILNFNFDWNYYSLTKCVEYSLENNEVKIFEDVEIRKKYNLVSQRDDLEDKYSHLCKQAEKLDYADEYRDEGVFECHYHNESVDGSHLYFGVILAWGDLPHGPYVLATSDGSKMKILYGTDISSPNKPKWLGNSIVFIKYYHVGEMEDGDFRVVQQLYYTNLDINENQIIDENITSYTTI